VSQSPVNSADFAAARNSQSAYQQSLAHLNELLRHGGTLSGHEANCAFLNTGDGPFATVSAVAGFDFLDDGRGLALADWDADGDVDIWTCNRTGPRLRFLRNDMPTQNHFVAFHLEGRRCNRDAIGARVEISHPAAPGAALVKSVRAGEGFLSQSSKWLNFGLGPQTDVSHVTIRWPDGAVQHFEHLAADQHYRIVQGESRIDAWRRGETRLQIHPGQSETPLLTEQARVPLTQRIPMPRLPVLAADNGTSELIPAAPTRPVLVNLWASWCAPCLQELSDLALRANDLKAAQLDVVAINVDQIAGGTPDSTSDASAIMARLNFPFASGQANDELINRLRTLHELPFATHVDLPIPISFLIDSQRRLAVIYRGSVEIEQVINDARQLALPDDRWSDSALPLPGRWNETPRRFTSLRLGRELVERRQLDDAREYVTRFQSELSSSKDFPKLLVWLGDELLASGQVQTAVQQYQAALSTDPRNVLAMNNLAWQLATHPDPQVRNGALAVRWAQEATKLTKALDAGVLDTLAASYAEAGRYDDAIKAVARAIELATLPDQTEFARRLRQRLLEYQNHRPHRSPSD
jgi:tetratricopeptide (TPR) repeat protein